MYVRYVSNTLSKIETTSTCLLSRCSSIRIERETGRENKSIHGIKYSCYMYSNAPGLYNEIACMAILIVDTDGFFFFFQINVAMIHNAYTLTV